MFQILTATELAALADGVGVEGSLGVLYQNRTSGALAAWNPAGQTMTPVSSVVTYRKSGGLTTGVGADLTFASAGGNGLGKLNTAVDIVIPVGATFIRSVFNTRRTGTDASFMNPNFGSANSTSDSNMWGSGSIGFDALVNPSDVLIEMTSSIAGGKLTTFWRAFVVNVGVTGGTAEVSGLDFTVTNYMTIKISGATTGSYRCSSYEVVVS